MRYKLLSVERMVTVSTMWSISPSYELMHACRVVDMCMYVIRVSGFPWCNTHYCAIHNLSTSMTDQFDPASDLTQTKTGSIISIPWHSHTTTSFSFPLSHFITSNLPLPHPPPLSLSLSLSLSLPTPSQTHTLSKGQLMDWQRRADHSHSLWLHVQLLRSAPRLEAFHLISSKPGSLSLSLPSPSKHITSSSEIWPNMAVIFQHYGHSQVDILEPDLERFPRYLR